VIGHAAEETGVSSIVLELQRDALDSSIRVSDLLRKALVVAKKLKIQEFETWTSAELAGYGKALDVPSYRILEGQIQAYNPYNRIWMPVVFQNAQQAERLSYRANGQSIAELEALAQKDDGKLLMPFPQHIQASLMQAAGLPFQPTLVVPHSGIIGILDAVRTIVLNWALKLEADGILGQDMSFTPQERQIASHHAYNINNFFGPVSGSQIQQGTTESTQQG
jgi:hypothetical protein